MTIHSKLAPFIAAGVLMSSVAAVAQTTDAPDPNLAPSTEQDDSAVPGTAANAPQLAKDPDPDEGLTTAGEEAELPATSAKSPQLATDPDPDLAPSGDGTGE